MLLCTFFQGTLVKEVYVHSLDQDERAQVSADQKNRQDIKDHTSNQIISNELKPNHKSARSIKYQILAYCRYTAIGVLYMSTEIKVQKCLRYVQDHLGTVTSSHSLSTRED